MAFRLEDCFIFSIDNDRVELFFQDILGGQPFSFKWNLFPLPPKPCKNCRYSPGGIDTLLPQRLFLNVHLPLTLGWTQGQYIAPYQEPFVLPSKCSDKRNKLNIEAFQSGKYPITRNLFVVVKQIGQIEQQAGVAYANLLLTEQG